MNTILGIFVITASGQIHGAHAVSAYSSVESCQKEMRELVPTVPIDKDQKLAYICLDFTADIQKAWGKVTT